MRGSPGRPLNARTFPSTNSRTGRARLAERGEPALRDLLLARAVADRLGRGVGARRELLERDADRLELLEVRVARPERRAQPVEPVAEDERDRARRDREEVVEVADGEGAAVAREHELAALEDPAELVAQHRDEHLVVELRLERRPVDVERRRPDRRRAVLEEVHPPAVPGPDPHVVRDEVEEDPHPAAPAGVGEPGVRLGAAELRREPPVIDDVVAVGRARGRLEHRREVDVGDAERLEVRHHPGRVVEAEPGVELEPVGRGGPRGRGLAPLELAGELREELVRQRRVAAARPVPRPALRHRAPRPPVPPARDDQPWPPSLPARTARSLSRSRAGASAWRSARSRGIR